MAFLVNRLRSVGRFSLALVLLVTANMRATAQETHTIIGGRVTDHMSKPVAHAKVSLRDNETGAVIMDTTDSRGRFEFYKPRCTSCALEVDPPDRTGLSMALIDYVPGNRTRQFSIHLQRGFLVSGKIVHAGKGLKGIFIQAKAVGEGNGADAVHGGGSTTSGGNGAFRLILTPGHKAVSIKNKRYPQLAAEHEATIDITADTPDWQIDLPPASK